jgi:hypothetical protein
MIRPFGGRGEHLARTALARTSADHRPEGTAVHRRYEVKTLLKGPAKPEMDDLMRVAALSGASLDAIVCLKVKDCREDGVFVFV